MGLLIQNSDNTKKRKLFLFISIGVNASILATLKFFNFLKTDIKTMSSMTSAAISNPALPLGLSYLIFKAISYNADVY